VVNIFELDLYKSVVDDYHSYVETIKKHTFNYAFCVLHVSMQWPQNKTVYF